MARRCWSWFHLLCHLGVEWLHLKRSTLGKMEGRRPGNYEPRIREDDFVQSQASIYVGEEYSKQAAKLKESVRMMLNEKDMRVLDQLELVDNLRRLGIHYHFEVEITRILETIYNLTNFNTNSEDQLYPIALQFRLLRQEGNHVPQEVFNIFMDEEGKFKEISFMDNIKGVLSLYEASYLSMEDESIMEMAQEWSIHHLKKYVEQKMDDDENNILVKQVKHALQMPLHWTMNRLEARWFIDNVYEQTECFNPILLDLAKLDFNMLQALYLDELKQLSRWDEKINLAEMMGFTRDRLVEGFFRCVGFSFESKFWYCRKWITKLGVFISIIDDMYELHGTLKELMLFTYMVDRWDVNAMEQLPRSMKMCFLALFNFMNELAYKILKEHDVNILPFLRKWWTEHRKTYLMDAKWYYVKHTPSFNEFLDYGCVSIVGPLVIKHFYICTVNPINKDDLDLLEKNPPLVQWSSLIGRLADDLATSPDEMERGDV